MTKQELENLLQAALDASKCGDDELLDRCLIELNELNASETESRARITDDAVRNEIIQKTETRLWNEARKVPGGYEYAGICSVQLCFRLKDGGELRFMNCEADDEDGNPSDNLMHIDYYDGALPPGITGPVWKTPMKEPT